jgi:hypothetical protein
MSAPPGFWSRVFPARGTDRTDGSYGTYDYDRSYDFQKVHRFYNSHKSYGFDDRATDGSPPRAKKNNAPLNYWFCSGVDLR